MHAVALGLDRDWPTGAPRRRGRAFCRIGTGLPLNARDALPEASQDVRANLDIEPAADLLRGNRPF